jgi:arachidonate 15-lipoxygenase
MRTLACLPNDDNQLKRQDYLNKMRCVYAYQYSYNDTFATIIKLPESEKADCTYQYGALKHLAGLIPSLPRIISTQFKQWFKTPISNYKDYLFFGRSSFSDTRFLDNFYSDEYIGLQRVIGINHVLLQGISNTHPLPSNLALERIKHFFSQIVSGESFESALENRRLFYVDYAMLQGLVEHQGEYAGRKQYVTAPIALFYRQNNGALQPIAIQLNQIPSEHNPVFMPLDNKTWTAAKLYLQIADVNYQELVTHATRIHYLVESFVIATHRELYKTHPVFLLLKPHLRYTLSVNVHHLFLKNKKGVPGDFGAQLAGNYDAMIALMAEAFKTYHFSEHALPIDLAKREVDIPELFYPYAEEGRQVWDLIQAFVRSYLDLYYFDDKMVQKDEEIQAWARLMVSNEGMRIKGFPSQFETIDELAQTIGQIIFITTAHHSTVHYPQYLFSGFTPSMPFAAYAPAPTNLEENIDLLKVLPLRQPAMKQAFTFYVTNFKLESLGQDNNFEEKVQPVIRQYQQKLAALTNQLNEASISRLYPYVYLNPQYIPNSVMV